MRRRFATLDVFTESRFAGNPLAVVLEPEGLDTPAMQKIAREFNLSETVFVFPPADKAATAPSCASSRRRANCRSPGIRPSAPRCCSARLDGGAGERTFTLEEKVGLVPCRVTSSGAGQRTRLVRHSAPAREGSRLARRRRDGGGARAAGRRHGPRRVCGGALVGGQSVHLRAGARARRDRAASSSISRASTRPSAAAITRRPSSSAARPPKPATRSMRACSRRSWACTRTRRPARRSRHSPAIWRRAGGYADGAHVVGIEQGYEMGRASQIELTLKIAGGKLTGAAIAGSAVVVMEGTLEA